MKNSLFVSFFIAIHAFQLDARNPRRPQDIYTPAITVKPSNVASFRAWVPVQEEQTLKSEYTCKDKFLRYNTLKQGFNHDYFQSHFLPKNQLISYRNGQGTVNSAKIDALGNQIVKELLEGKTEFTHATILKDKDFNWRTRSGLLVLQFKDYPFVMKLSIEHPHTMTKPYSKSFEANCIFIIGGNLRHLSNFSRIMNLEHIKHMLSHNQFYLDNISFPRKWYWKPKNSYNLLITWHESEFREEEQFVIPNAYAVICDLINIDETYSQQELNKLSMKISCDTGFLIDPHAGNCVKDKDTNMFTLLDTENFKTMVGLENNLHAKKYIAWYMEMAYNGLITYCGRSKQARIRHAYGLSDS